MKHIKKSANILALGLLAIFVTACVNVNVPRRTRVDVNAGGYDYTSDDMTDDPTSPTGKVRKISKKRARQYADQLVLDNNLNPDDYKIEDEKVRHNYWFIYEARKPGKPGDWRNHFAIRVSPQAEISFYKRPAPMRKSNRK